MCVCASVYFAQPRDRNFRAHCRASRPVKKKNKNTNKNHHHNHNHKGKRRFYLPPHRIFFSLASPLHFFFGSFPAFRSFRFTNYWKNTIFRDFPIFLRSWIFFSYLFFLFILYFSSLILPISAFHLSIFSEIFNF